MVRGFCTNMATERVECPERNTLPNERRNPHRKKQAHLRSERISTGMNSTRESEFVQRWTPNRHKCDTEACHGRQRCDNDVGRVKRGEEDLLVRAA